MADTKQNSTGRYYQIAEGAYVYPLDPNIKRIKKSGKWGTPMPSSNYIVIQPASRKKR